MFSSTIEAVSEAIENIKEKAEEFFEENKKMALIIAGLSFVILVCLILLIISIGSEKDKKNNSLEVEQLILSENLLIPDGPSIPRDYNISRTTKNEWSEEEVNEWFTNPSSKEIESLSKTNDNMIKEIIGAAP